MAVTTYFLFHTSYLLPTSHFLLPTSLIPTLGYCLRYRVPLISKTNKNRSSRANLWESNLFVSSSSGLPIYNTLNHCPERKSPKSTGLFTFNMFFVLFCTKIFYRVCKCSFNGLKADSCKSDYQGNNSSCCIIPPGYIYPECEITQP